MAKTPLRNWSMPSYGVDNGRPVSSIGGTDHAKGVSAQIPREGGHDKSGSADGSRPRLNGSKLQ